MAVQYKMRGAQDFDSIDFQGIAISVAALKGEIMRKHQMQQTDLILRNAQTDEGRHTVFVEKIEGLNGSQSIQTAHRFRGTPASLCSVKHDRITASTAQL